MLALDTGFLESVINTVKDFLGSHFKSCKVNGSNDSKVLVFGEVNSKAEYFASFHCEFFTMVGFVFVFIDTGFKMSKESAGTVDKL